MNERTKSRGGIVNWVAATLSILGIFLNAYKLIWCWPVWVGSNVLWLIYLVPKKEWAQVVLWSAFLVSNFYAWYQWAH